MVLHGKVWITDTHYNTDEPQKHAKVKDTRHQRSHIICFHVYEISRIRKSTETESQLVVTRDRWEGKVGSDSLMGTEAVSGLMKMFRIRLWWWLHHLVDELKATELYTWKWFKMVNLCFMNFTSIFKERERESVCVCVCVRVYHNIKLSKLWSVHRPDSSTS